MHLVRMQHCTPCFAGTVMPQSSLVQQSFLQSELPLLPECCTCGGLDVMKAADCQCRASLCYYNKLQHQPGHRKISNQTLVKT